MRRWISLRGVLIVAAGLGLLVSTVAGAYLWHLQREIADASTRKWGSQPGGTLILSGGGIVPDEIYDCFVQCAAGTEARIVVIPAYQTSESDEIRLKRPFIARGVESVDVLAGDRSKDTAFAAAKLLEDATGIWFTGGDQSHLTDSFVGTEVERQLSALLQRGGVIAGTSAGAAAMTRVMIRGQGVDPTRRGFDLLPNAIVDQHFFQRNRPQRLLEALAEQPALVGLGIDEGTAVVAENRGARWSVIGRSYVMVCVPSETGFPRIEILRPGDSTNIDYLRVERGITAISSPGAPIEVIGGDSW